VTGAEAQSSRYWTRKVEQRCLLCGCGLLPEWGGKCPECTLLVKAAQAKYNRSRKGARKRRLGRRRYYERYTAKVLAKRRDRWVAKQQIGECQMCPARATDGDHCAVHADARRDTARKSAAKSAQARLAAGLCTRCGKVSPEDGKRQCTTCCARVAAWKAARGETYGGRPKDKARVLKRAAMLAEHTRAA
jgi:hypothetical protein